MSALAIIPARYASTRFEGKPLVDLCGQTMLERVWNATCKATLIDRVVVATDDPRIQNECTRIGAECVMTSPTLESGTDRVAEAYRELSSEADIVLNVQGDEPLLDPTVLDQLVAALRDAAADVATPVRRIETYADLVNPTICKVTRRTDGSAMYFSRSVIPHVRGSEQSDWLNQQVYWKHIGIYAYRAETLLRFRALPPSSYERSESLEQLRLLGDGAVYQCVETSHDFIAIDTPADAELVRSILLNLAGSYTAS